jgi:hypothetical protein
VGSGTRYVDRFDRDCDILYTSTGEFKMGSSRTGSKLANISKLWNKGRETTANEKGAFGEAVPVDVGRYQMQLVGFNIGDYGGERKVMEKWVVLDEGDHRGAICTRWEGIADEERIIWLQRTLAGLGVDLEEKTIESEDDLAAVYQELVDDKTVAKVKVTEKDGWTNMRVGAKVDVDSGDLFDPGEVMKDAAKGARGGSGGGSSGGKGDSGGAVEFDKGDRVSFKIGSKTYEGEITGFDKDDNAEIEYEKDGKTRDVTLDLNELEKIDGGGDGKGKEVEVGDAVMVKVDKKSKLGEVKKVKGDQVTVKVAGKEIVFDVGDVEVQTDD